MLSISKVAGHPIWHIQSPHRFELALAFLRMQEYQESPNNRFRGKVFTLDAYMDWYMRETTSKHMPDDAFTYGRDWVGFNVRAYAVDAVARLFRPHTVWEQALFALIDREHVREEEECYLIGTRIGETPNVFEHELRHGLFGVNARYRAEVLAVLDRFPVLAFRERLAKDYAREVLDDEVQAYALTGYGDTYGKTETA
jgi:hypothetical protein